MRSTLYALAAILLSVGIADIGRSAPRSLISKKTSAAIGLTQPHAAKGRQARSVPPNDNSTTARTESFHKVEPEKPQTVRNEPTVNGRSLSQLSLSAPVVPLPTPASGLQAELQRIQAQRKGGFPPFKASPLPSAQQPQPAFVRNETLKGSNTLHHSALTLAPLGGVAVTRSIGALNGTSFQPRRR